MAQWVLWGVVAERKFFLPWHLKGYHLAGEEVEVRWGRARVLRKRIANMVSHQSASVEKTQSFSYRIREAIRTDCFWVVPFTRQDNRIANFLCGLMSTLLDLD
ncbi:hypothetical protein AHAS_Ahas15G0143400 [Arachis hypogaea]